MINWIIKDNVSDNNDWKLKKEKQSVTIFQFFAKLSVYEKIYEFFTFVTQNSGNEEL